MAFSGFISRTIQGLSSTQNTPQLTSDETTVIALLDQLTEKLTLKRKNDASEYTEAKISFSMLADPNSQTDIVFIEHAFAFLHEQRQSSIYLNWREKISRNEALTPEEILAYSLITNDINELTSAMIEAVLSHASHHTEAFKAFSYHIRALSYAHTLNHSEDKTLRFEALQSLSKLFYQRADTARQTGLLRLCNLASIRLDNIALTDMYLHWVNLNYANFTNALFHAFNFDHCSLNGANFKNAATWTPFITQGITFSNCSLNEASLITAKLVLTAEGCTFQKANFTSAVINATFNGCNLKQCNFTGAHLKKSTHFDDLCLLSESNFSSAKFHMTIKPTLFDDTLILFNNAELSDTTELTRKLNALDPGDKLTPDEWHQYRILIASILLNQLRLSTTNNTRPPQADIINAALEHGLFKSKNPLKSMYNQLTSGLGLFSGFNFTKTTAEVLLQTALDAPRPTLMSS